jgi:hypothetical protein
MSIDWIALGSVLAAFPIVLLLCFTGCFLDRHGQAPPNPAFVYPAGLNLHTLQVTVTMTLFGVNDTRGPDTLPPFVSPNIPANAGSLTFSDIDASTVNTSPPGGEGLIGPALTLTCECFILLEGNTSVLLTASHDGDDVDSLDLVFNLGITGLGTASDDYLLA